MEALKEAPAHRPYKEGLYPVQNPREGGVRHQAQQREGGRSQPRQGPNDGATRVSHLSTHLREHNLQEEEGDLGPNQTHLQKEEAVGEISRQLNPAQLSNFSSQSREHYLQRTERERESESHLSSLKKREAL
jgi:hypothetical protein